MGRNEEISENITKIFKGLVLNRIEYSDTFEEFEVHFEGGKYFTIGAQMTAGMRIVQHAKEEKNTDD